MRVSLAWAAARTRQAELPCRVGRVISLVRIIRCALRFGGNNATTSIDGGSVMKGRTRLSLFLASWLLAGVAIAAPALAHDKDDDRCAGARDIKLVNGKIHTLDARNSIVSSVTIKDGKFTAGAR